MMAARELARSGKKVTILEARDRCGGRIYPLSAQEFGYPAEGGAEFVHGAATVTRALMREAGAYKMFLLADEENEPAMGLYEATGGKREPDQVMWIWGTAD